MQNNKEIIIDEVKKDGYIEWDKELLAIFNPFDTQPSKQRDRGEDINILMYITNVLNLNLNNNPDLEELTIEVTHSQFMNMITYQPIQNKKVKLKDIETVIEKINGISKLMILKPDKIECYSIYSRITASGFGAKDITYTIDLNPMYIEYYKSVRERSNDYFKVTLDVMLSLNTRSAKILYGYLCCYNAQMNNPNNKRRATNITGVNHLKHYLDSSRVCTGVDEWEYHMLNANLVRIVETALEQINKVIIEKSERYEEYYPIYKVEWFNANPKIKTGRTSGIESFRFSIDKEYEKANKNKYKKKESYEQIICDFTNYEPLRNALRQWISKGKEANELPSMKSFKTQLENLREGVGEDEAILDIIEHAGAYGYRSFGYKKEVADKHK